MGLPKEVVIHAIRVTKSPEEAAELLAKYEYQREKVAVRKRKIKVIQERAEKEIQILLNLEICPHDIRKRRCDPSGNNDSYDECLICGEEITDHQVRFT